MNSTIKIFHWIPRILCILAIIFVSMFSLDAFTPGLTTGQQIVSFIMHLIPSFVLIALLIFTWKWEYFGGLIFCIVGVFFSITVFIMNYQINHSILTSLSVIIMVTIPFVLVGILFIVSHKKKEKLQLKDYKFQN